MAGGVDWYWHADKSVLPEGTTLDDYFRVMFFSRVLIEGKETIEWHDAIRCRDKYKDRIDRKQDGIDDEFRSDYWICPDIDEIALQNNPATYQTGNGQNFNLIITSCGEAKRLEEVKGKKSYNSNYDNCQDVNTD